ncbi:hypothetical protein VQ042_20255 [Aurantimonas sp. A2-1-M11]|uniref:hypothetical protein n=1 Tax=Aurantimonas sp. A2-1-M11 TaxID=3113712 RepID=UPI002F93AA6D
MCVKAVGQPFGGQIDRPAGRVCDDRNKSCGRLNGGIRFEDLEVIEAKTSRFGDAAASPPKYRQSSHHVGFGIGGAIIGNPAAISVEGNSDGDARTRRK